MRRRYEALVILDVNLGDEGINSTIEKLENLINSSEDGELIITDRWGKKRLAYEIKKKQYGFYVLFEFFAGSVLPNEFEKICNFDSNIMRQMVVLIPDVVVKLREQEQKLRETEEARRQEIASSKDEVHVDLLETVELEEDIDDIDLSSESDTDDEDIEEKSKEDEKTKEEE
ncbi:30S ribosomal protein S6 [bacterium]|nr:30S ribosomal protein S6 [bacterium]